MSLVKSNKRNLPFFGESLMSQDPFFSDLMDTRRGLFNLNRVFNGDVDRDYAPAINVKDTEKEYQVELAAPGLKKEDFKITMDDGILTISAEKEQNHEEEKEGFVRKEFSYNSFVRSMSLPETIDEDKEVKAEYRDGILKLMLSKKPVAKQKEPKTIKVS
ncbi:MAG: Hsp20/alpha crystallin family protein [Salegentibacter sp.]